MREEPDPTGPAPPPDDVFRWNEAMVRRYDIERYYAEAAAPVRWIEERRIRAVVELADRAPGDRVLDVGCGVGHVLERFGPRNVVGVDLSPTMLSGARRRLGPDPGLVRAFAERLPFPESAFDVVVCTEVLEHTMEPRSTLRELARVASPGGRIVISIPNEPVIERLKRACRWIPGARRLRENLAEVENPWHLHRIGPAVVRRHARGVAVIERIRRIPLRLLPIRYALLLRPSRSVAGPGPGGRGR